jgi:cytochrome P450
MSDSGPRTRSCRTGRDQDPGSHSGDIGARILCLAPGADGHRLYRQIRQRGPLVPSRDGLLFTASWAVADAILRSRDFGAVPTMVSGGDLLPRDADLVHPLDDAFFSLDPPRHTQLRAAVIPSFSRRCAAAWSAHIGQVVESRLDAIADRDSADLIQTLAEPVPLLTVCWLLGLTTTDVATFTRWADVITNLMDGPRTPEQAARIRGVCVEMTAYFRRHIATTRRQPRLKGLVADLAARCPADLDEHDVIATSGMMLLAGFATTVNLIGSGLHALISDPRQRSAADGNWDAVVEEALRHSGPVQYVVRRAKRPTTISGIHIPVRTPVVILLAAANRDPSVFAHPDRFDPSRGNLGQHLSFGTGIHYCIGTSLARAETRTVLSRFFTRYPNATLSGPATPRPSRVLHGPCTLPVQLNTR